MGQHHALWDALVMKGCYEKLSAETNMEQETEEEGPATMDAIMQLGATLVEMGVLSPETYQQMHAEYRPVETPPEGDPPAEADKEAPEEDPPSDAQDDTQQLPLEEQDDAQEV